MRSQGWEGGSEGKGGEMKEGKGERERERERERDKLVAHSLISGGTTTTTLAQAQVKKDQIGENGLPGRRLMLLLLKCSRLKLLQQKCSRLMLLFVYAA